MAKINGEAMGAWDLRMEFEPPVVSRATIVHTTLLHELKE